MKKTPIKIEYFRDILDIASRDGELPNVCRSLDIYIGDVKTILYRKEIDLLKEVLIRAGEVDAVDSSNWNSSDKSVNMEMEREEYDGSYYPVSGKNAIKILKWVYDGASIFMNRKKDRYKTYLK